MALVAESRPSGAVARFIEDVAVSGSVAGITVHKSTIWVQADILTLLCLGLHCCFTTSYLDSKAPTKALLTMDGCQIMVVVEGYEEEISYSAILLMSCLSNF